MAQQAIEGRAEARREARDRPSCPATRIEGDERGHSVETAACNRGVILEQHERHSRRRCHGDVARDRLAVNIERDGIGEHARVARQHGAGARRGQSAGPTPGGPYLDEPHRPWPADLDALARQRLRGEVELAPWVAPEEGGPAPISLAPQGTPYEEGGFAASVSLGIEPGPRAQAGGASRTGEDRDGGRQSRPWAHPSSMTSAGEGAQAPASHRWHGVWLPACPSCHPCASACSRCYSCRLRSLQLRKLLVLPRIAGVSAGWFL